MVFLELISLNVKLPLPGCKERLQKVLSCTVAGLVNGLGTSNVEQYLEVLQELSIISPEHLDLREKVREAVKNGPQLHVCCKTARLPGISKREKVKVEVFVQGRKEKHFGVGFLDGLLWFFLGVFLPPTLLQENLH